MEELIEMHGKVEEVLPDSRFRVTLDQGHSLVACTSGEMCKHPIRILAGDKASLEWSPYDLSKGGSPSATSKPGPAARRARRNAFSVERVLSPETAIPASQVTLETCARIL